MSPLPETNATLTLVTAKAGGDRYEGPAAAGPQLWAGESRVYFEETGQLKASKGDVTRVDPGYAAIDQADGVVVERGATVTLELDAGGIVTRRVQVVDRFDLLGMTQLGFWEA